jgi:hypothetical protein
MSKNFVLRAAICVVALVCASVVLEGQASAKLFGGRHHGSGGGEGSCGCAAEEPSCGCAAATEPSCAAPAEASCAAEPSCGCAAEPSCGCSSEPSCGCSSGHGRLRGLFGHRHRGGGDCGCEASCGAPAECGCNAPAVAAPADGATPPAPEAPAT